MTINRELRYPFFFLLLSVLLITHTKVCAFQTTTGEGVCGPDIEDSQECIDEASPEKESVIHPVVPERPKDRVPEKKKREIPSETKGEIQDIPLESQEIIVYFFWGAGCPHCKEEKLFLKEMQTKYPRVKVRDYEVWYDKQNAALLAVMAKAYNIKTTGVPVTFIDERVHIGFSKHSLTEIEDSIHKCLSVNCIDPAFLVAGKVPPDKPEQIGKAPEKTEDLECTEKSKTIYIPWVGNLDASEMSLPVMTLVIAGLDSFNPCAFFVLFSLLGLLIHAQSRRKMFLIGSIFVFFSGFIYFVFMAAWLNLFLVMGQVAVITRIAGLIAVLIAVINIKDYFVFKRGVSLTIPDSAKPKLFDRMRKLLKSTSVLSILVGTVVLAVTANAYELLCTAGFPMVFTRILTLNNVSAASHYLYLVLYNVIYVVPLSVIVVIFTITLGKRQLTEKQGRVMKLVSGAMMLGLGGALILNPAILSNALISFFLLLGALIVSLLTALITKRLGYS